MTEKNTSPTRIFLEVSGVTLIAFFLSLIAGVIFLFSSLILGYSVDSSTVITGIIILGQVVLLMIALIYIDRREITVPLEVPSRPDLLYVGVGTVIVLITATGLSQILYLFDLMPESVIEEIGTADPTFLIVLAVLSVVLIAPAEELLFRGAIQGRLNHHFGPYSAILIASFLFGALHLGNYEGTLLPVIAGVILIIIIGVVLGFLYKRTKNLAVPILVHAIYNVVFLVSGYFTIV